MVLDHVLARAIRSAGRGGLTAALTVTYRRPVPLGVPLVATAEMGAIDGRRTTVSRPDRRRGRPGDDPGRGRGAVRGPAAVAAESSSRSGGVPLPSASRDGRRFGVAEEFGWVSYSPLPASVPAPDDDDCRPEFADLGRLARRGLRAVVSAARAGERPRLARILGDHLGPGATGFDVVEETWPAYDHVNVQAGLDAWLADPRRRFDLVGVTNFQHAMFGLGDLLSDVGQHHPMGLRPGNPATVNLACGPDGAGPPLPAVRDLPGARRGRADGAAPARRRTGVRHRSRVGADREHRRRSGRRRRRGDPAGGAGPQRLPGAGALVRPGGVRARADAAAVPPPAHDGRRPADPRAADPGRGAAAGRRGGPPQGAAARGRPAPQARAAALRPAGDGKDAHRPVPDEQPRSARRSSS